MTGEDSSAELLFDSDESELTKNALVKSGLFDQENTPPWPSNYIKFMPVMQNATESFDEQKERGNTIFLDKMMSNSAWLRKTVVHIKRLMN